MIRAIQTVQVRTLYYHDDDTRSNQDFIAYHEPFAVDSDSFVPVPPGYVVVMVPGDAIVDHAVPGHPLHVETIPSDICTIIIDRRGE